jgi:hypothetical protein
MNLAEKKRKLIDLLGARPLRVHSFRSLPIFRSSSHIFCTSIEKILETVGNSLRSETRRSFFRHPTNSIIVDDVTEFLRFPTKQKTFNRLKFIAFFFGAAERNTRREFCDGMLEIEDAKRTKELKVAGEMNFMTN